MTYYSRSCRSRYTVLNFKRWEYSCNCGHFQQHMYCRNGYLWTSGVNSDFLSECKISEILRRFSLIFAFYTLNVLHFLLPVFMAYGNRKYATRVERTSIIPNKFEDPTPIRSWVTSYNASRWLSLKMRMRPLRMRRITWPTKILVTIR